MPASNEALRASWWLLALCACGSSAAPPQATGSGSGVRADAGLVAPAPRDAAGPAVCLDERALNPGFNPTPSAGFEAGTLRVCMGYHDNEQQLHRACVGLDPGSGRATPAGIADLAPGLDLPGGTFERRAGKAFVCTADHACKPLGKRAAKAAKAAARSREPMRGVTATADGAVLIIGSEAWSVAADRKLKLARPDDAADDEQSGSLRPIGRFLFGSWTPCAGPCTVDRLYAPDGKVLVPSLGTELPPVAIDGERWAIAVHDKLEVFALATAQRLHEIALVARDAEDNYQLDGETFTWSHIEPEQTIVVPVGGSQVATVFYDDQLVVIADVATGAIVRRFRIPICRAAE